MPNAKRNNWKLMIGCLMAVLLGACFEPQEGCLDVEATNYDVTADDPCLDCCTFPSLRLAMRHVVIRPDGQDMTDTSFFFRYNQFYPIPSQMMDSFTIERIRYFLSDIRLVRPNGEEVTVIDSISLETNFQELRIPAAFAKVDRDITATANLGTLVESGAFDRIRFKVGLPDSLLTVNPNTAPDNSVFDVGIDTIIYRDTIDIGFLSAAIAFNRDTMMATDSTVVDIKMQTDDIELPFESEFTLNRGFDATVTIQVDYLRWFENIDIPNHDPDNLEPLRLQFLENIPTSFSVFEVR